MKVILVDAYNLLHRVYHIHKDLKNSYNIPTGATFGFFRMLLYYRKVLRCRNIILCWEGNNSWRKEFYKDYKSNRVIDEISNEIKDKIKDDKIISAFATKEIYDLGLDEKQLKQIELNFSSSVIKNLASTLRILNVAVYRFESDDIIAYLTKKFFKNVKIISADKDLLQLVNDKRKIRIVCPNFNNKSYQIINEKEVLFKHGVYPEEIPLLLALKGDKTDNIEGLPGIGEKRAVQLVKEMRLKNFSNIAKKEGFDKKIIERNLMLINLNVVLPMINSQISKNNFSFEEKINIKKLQSILQFLEIKSYGIKELLNLSATNNFINFIERKIFQ